VYVLSESPKEPPASATYQPPSVTNDTPMMKAIVHRKFEEPAVLTVRELGEPAPGDDSVLIHVVAAGTWAVRLAKSLGAHVTAICSTPNVEIVSPPPSSTSLGSNGMLDNIKLVHSALLFAVIATCAGPRMVSAAGSDNDASSGWTGSVGLGVGRQPTYVGSPNERTTPVPLLSVRYNHPIHGTIAFDPRGLSWTSPEQAGFRVGVLVGFDLGREARGVGFDPFVTGDDRLRGMGDIESTAEGGVLIGYGLVTLSVRKAIGDRGHAGLVADMSFDWSLDLSEKIGLSLGAGTRWADQKYQQAYFGVTPAQAAASRFSRFTPVEGFVQGNVNIGLEYRFTEAWSAQLGATYARLIEATRSSPLAEEPNGITALLGLTRRFE